MNTQEIQSLIDRYLAAETSNDEERRLALALHEAAAATGGDLPDDWQAVLLMLDELTLGEALYDDILSRRSSSPSAQSSSAHSVSLSTKRPRGSRLRLWRWAAAAVLVLAAGLGVALYHSALLQRPADDVSLISETRLSHQRDTSARPVALPDTTSRIAPHDQSHQPARLVASGNTTVGKKHSRRKARQARPQPEKTEVSSVVASVGESLPSREDVDAAFPPDSYADIEAEMRDIRARGQRVEAMIAELTRPIE